MKGDVLQISEKLRLKLLQEEFKLRKKQPQAWTVQKYRKYANIGIRKKKEKREFIEEERDFDNKLLLEKPRRQKKAKALKKKSRARTKPRQKAKKPARARAKPMAKRKKKR